jgi:hypothetical protein
MVAAPKFGAKTMATPKKPKTPAKKAAQEDWRAKTLSHVRALIKQAVPDAVETRKWGGTPVFERNGIICTGETYKDKVKLTFAKGASIKDPARVFNSSLDGNMRRAYDIFENDKINEEAFKKILRDAAALNTAKKAPRAKSPAKKATAKKAKK